MKIFASFFPVPKYLKACFNASVQLVPKCLFYTIVLTAEESKEKLGLVCQVQLIHKYILKMKLTTHLLSRSYCKYFSSEIIEFSENEGSGSNFVKFSYFPFS